MCRRLLLRMWVYVSDVGEWVSGCEKVYCIVDGCIVKKLLYCGACGVVHVFMWKIWVSTNVSRELVVLREVELNGTAVATEINITPCE